MPLRDHFNPPVSSRSPWDALHGAWPTLIVMDLNKKLPARYVASPRVHLGAAFEIDVVTSEFDEPLRPSAEPYLSDDNGGVATAVYAPPHPTLTLETDLPEQDEYEVRVFDNEEQRIVAAIEIVSPANKDRPSHRRAFTAKCATLLQQKVSVVIVDVVTVRNANLYADLLEMLSQSDPSLLPAPPSLYAVACRAHEMKHSWKLETWVHTLVLGSALPTLPLWLSPDLAIPLNLEPGYEDTCRALRIS